MRADRRELHAALRATSAWAKAGSYVMQFAFEDGPPPDEASHQALIKSVHGNFLIDTYVDLNDPATATAIEQGIADALVILRQRQIQKDS